MTAENPSGSDAPSRFQAWVLASRPKTLLAAVAPVAVGTGLAEAREEFALGPALAALVGAVLIQIGTNLANDYYDHVRGGDTVDRVGPVRVTQAGILAPEAVRRSMWVVFGAAFLTGIYLVSVAGWPVVVIGLLSLLSGWAYTGGPFPLAYHGLGDVFVFTFFGLVAVGGTYYVQALSFDSEVLLAGSGMGALTTAILVVNNLRDLETDARAGKRTLAVRIGVVGTQLEYLLLLGLAFAVPLLGVALFDWTPWTFLCLLAAAAAAVPVHRVLRRGREPAALAPALGQTAGVTAVYGLLLAGGLAFG
ncbi:MAG: 1,4-dihydroxy-2-naphthoate polyprenyltransferase [Longimicrobiales bacterium]|nr:1,4-dihydroxy-2-naphthoate polyprenyltransferase [Longimicrobiales bacterium]